MKSFKKFRFSSGIVIGIIIGVAIAGGAGIAIAENIASSTVDYNKNSQATVEDALDDLYEKASEAGIIPYTGDNLAIHIKNLHSYDGDGSYLYYHDQTGNNGTYTSAEYEAGDESYRYSGPSASVSNYVCFASDEETCPSENLYRIIGIFKDTNNNYQTKLIKASIAQATVNGATMLGTNGGYASSTSYYWDKEQQTSIWSNSKLNTVNLNTNYVNYLNAINSKWLNMIDTHTWVVGGNTYTYIESTEGVQNVYDKEIVHPAANTTYNAKIGLMYVSDYMYGASPNHWSKGGYMSSKGSSYDYRSAYNDDWIYINKQEWTITRVSNVSNYSLVNIVGTVNAVWNNAYDAGGVGNTYPQNSGLLRPVFYLKSDVYFYDGTGTSSDPYRIGI